MFVSEIPIHQNPYADDDADDDDADDDADDDDDDGDFSSFSKL